MDINQDKKREAIILQGTQFLVRLKKQQKSKVKAISIDQIHNSTQLMELKVISFSEFITQITFLIHKCFKFKVDLVLKGKLYISEQKTVFGHYSIISQYEKPLCRKIYFHGVKNKQQRYNSQNNRIGICQFQGIYYNFKGNENDQLFQIGVRATYKYFYHKFKIFLPKLNTHYIYQPSNAFHTQNITSKQFIVMLQELQLFKKHSFLLKVQKSLFLLSIALDMDNFKYFKQKLTFQSDFLAQTKQKNYFTQKKINNTNLNNLNKMVQNKLSTSNKQFQFQKQKLKLLILKGKQLNQTFQKASSNRQTIKFVPCNIIEEKYSDQVAKVMFQLYGNSPKLTKKLQNLSIQFSKQEGTTFQQSHLPIFTIQYYYNSSIEKTMDQNLNLSNLSFQSSGKNPILKGNWLIINKIDYKRGGYQQQKIFYFIELVLQAPFKIEQRSHQDLFMNWNLTFSYGTFYHYQKQKSIVYLKRKIIFQSLNKIYQELIQEIDTLLCSYLNFEQMFYRAERTSNHFMKNDQKIIFNNLEQEEKRILKARNEHYSHLYQLLFNNYKKQLAII